MKNSTNPAHLEMVTNEQIVSHLERELEINGLEAPDELQMKTVTKKAKKSNLEKPKPTCRHCQKRGHQRNQCRHFKLEKDQAQNKTNSSGNKNNKNAGPTNSNSNNKTPHNTNTNNANNRNDGKPKTVYRPCEMYGKTKHSTEKR